MGGRLAKAGAADHVRFETLDARADDMRDRLQQAKRRRLGEKVARFAQDRFAATGQRCDLLDVGGSTGILRRYIEVQPGEEFVNFHGAGAFPNGRSAVYKSRDWTLSDCSIESGPLCLESNAYDVVICELTALRIQRVEMALRELARVLKPGGLIILGVPTYPAGMLFVRRFLSLIAGSVRTRRTRERFNRSPAPRLSARSLTKMICRTTDLCAVRSKIFRAAAFRPTEVQIMATKKSATGSWPSTAESAQMPA